MRGAYVVAIANARCVVARQDGARSAQRVERVVQHFLGPAQHDLEFAVGQIVALAQRRFAEVEERSYKKRQCVSEEEEKNSNNNNNSSYRYRQFAALHSLPHELERKDIEKCQLLKLLVSIKSSPLTLKDGCKW